jgi:hypothetical protein
MAEYHDFTTFLESAHAVLSQIVEHTKLADARIDGPVRSDPRVPSVTLKWEAEDGTAEKNIDISVFDDPWEPIAEVEVGAWKDVETQEKNRGETVKFRRMVCKSVETLRDIHQYDSAKAVHELNGALWQAYAQSAQLDLQKF